MTFKTEMRVQWFDMDRADVVYFGNYFRFFTAAEDEFLRSIGMSYTLLKDKYKVGLARVEAQCRYIRAAKYEDLIEVHIIPKLENEIFLIFEFRILRKEGQVLLAEGKVRAACVRWEEKFSLVRMPEEVFNLFSQASNRDTSEGTI